MFFVLQFCKGRILLSQRNSQVCQLKTFCSLNSMKHIWEIFITQNTFTSSKVWSCRCTNEDPTQRWHQESCQTNPQRFNEWQQTSKATVQHANMAESSWLKSCNWIPHLLKINGWWPWVLCAAILNGGFFTQVKLGDAGAYIGISGQHSMQKLWKWSHNTPSIQMFLERNLRWALPSSSSGSFCTNIGSSTAIPFWSWFTHMPGKCQGWCWRTWQVEALLYSTGVGMWNTCSIRISCLTLTKEIQKKNKKPIQTQCWIVEKQCWNVENCRDL